MNSHVVIVLAYNEKDNIGELLSALDWEDVIAVVDGDDGTADIAKKYCTHVLISKTKRGYGGALLDGITFAFACGYKYATVMDVGTCDPDFLYVYTKDADIIVRARRGSMLDFRYLLSKVALICLSVVTLSRVKDATFGYRTYNLQRIIPILSKVRTNGHSTNMEILGLALKNKLAVRYESVPYTLDENSQLKAKDIMEAVRCIIRLIFTPRLST